MIYQGMNLRASEHGRGRRWVLWINDHTIGGQADYAVVQPRADIEEVIAAPGHDVDMAAYVQARVKNHATKTKAGEHIWYNWLKPYDWLRGTITSVDKKKKDSNWVKVQFEKCPSASKGFTASVVLNPAQYGERNRWVITSTKPAS